MSRGGSGGVLGGERKKQNHRTLCNALVQLQPLPQSCPPHAGRWLCFVLPPSCSGTDTGLLTPTISSETDNGVCCLLYSPLISPFLLQVLQQTRYVADCPCPTSPLCWVQPECLPCHSAGSFWEQPGRGTKEGFGRGFPIPGALGGCLWRELRRLCPHGDFFLSLCRIH